MRVSRNNTHCLFQYARCSASTVPLQLLWNLSISITEGHQQRHQHCSTVRLLFSYKVKLVISCRLQRSSQWLRHCTAEPKNAGFTLATISLISLTFFSLGYYPTDKVFKASFTKKIFPSCSMYMQGLTLLVNSTRCLDSSFSHLMMWLESYPGWHRNFPDTVKTFTMPPASLKETMCSILWKVPTPVIKAVLSVLYGREYCSLWNVRPEMVSRSCSTIRLHIVSPASFWTKPSNGPDTARGLLKSKEVSRAGVSDNRQPRVRGLARALIAL